MHAFFCSNHNGYKKCISVFGRQEASRNRCELVTQDHSQVSHCWLTQMYSGPFRRSRLPALRAATGPRTYRKQWLNRCCLLPDVGPFCHIAVTSKDTSIMKTCPEDQVKLCGEMRLARETAVGRALSLPGPVFRCGKSPDVCTWPSRAENCSASHTQGLTHMHWLLAIVEPETLQPCLWLGCGFELRA